MSLEVIEGTWEEIKLHEADLAGRYLRVTIATQIPAQSSSRLPTTTQSHKFFRKKLIGFGAFKNALPSTEVLMREKPEELDNEERGH